MSTVLPSEKAAVVGVIDPDVTIASTVSTGWVAAKDFHSFMAVVFAGTLGSSATFDAKLQQATAAAGTGVKDITGKAITQVTASDKQAIINCRTEELDVEGGFAFIRLSIIVAVATSDAAGVLIGMDARMLPASDFDAATVVEIV